MGQIPRSIERISSLKISS